MVVSYQPSSSPLGGMMATKKAKLEKAEANPRKDQGEGRSTEVTPADDEMRRLLRTVAWRRMFGRVTGTKNPFRR
jgi:hypothetical protein